MVIQLKFSTSTQHGLLVQEVLCPLLALHTHRHYHYVMHKYIWQMMCAQHTDYSVAQRMNRFSLVPLEQALQPIASFERGSQ